MRKALWQRSWFAPVVIAGVVGAVGWWAQSTVEGAVKRQVGEQLSTLLNAEVAALTLWSDIEKSEAQRFALDPVILGTIVDLLRVAADPDGGPSAVLASRELAAFREVMDASSIRSTVRGYGVVDLSGRIVAAKNDAAIGRRVGTSVAEWFDRIVAGETAIFGPVEYPVAEGERDSLVLRPAIFVAAPVRNSRNDVIAALVMRYSPADEFSGLLHLAQFGASGESYAFNSSGVMITESRFTDQLQEVGLVEDGPDASSILAIEIRNPGGNLLLGHQPDLPRAALPYTRMAAAAIAGIDGVDVEGYLDYRGVPVVGAWRWLPDYGFGVAMEVDVQEAYETLYVVRQGFWALVALLMLGAVGIFFYNFLFQDMSNRMRKAERLGQYTLEEKIGEGGMGSVYKAKHAMLRRPTAIKLIKEGQVKPETLVRFEREVQLTSQLANPNTVAIYDYGRTPEGVFYYAMEYLPGITLDNLVLNDGPQPERRVVHILRQICSSLAEAHARGMIHRDIKPANIMLLERGGLYDVIKVLDFGLVKDITSGDQNVTAMNTVPGTPHFLSPEAIQHPDAIDARSDLYAVGAVGYFLLTGSFVFSGTSAIEVLGKQVNDTPEDPSERLGRSLDPYLEGLILQCLAKDPADRPADAGVLLEALSSGYQSPIGTWTQKEAAVWWAESSSDCRAPECMDSMSMEPTLEVDALARVRGTTT
ncbi:MAG: serine/threonine protein kinase [Planctomycetota bacterium]|nr:MAG: serine/threonine protein kinase [Planctomycetota bacterium]